MQNIETAAIGFETEHGAPRRSATILRRAVKIIAGQDQTSVRVSTVVVRPIARVTSIHIREVVQVSETCAICFDGEHRSSAPSASLVGSATQRISRQS